MCILPYIISVGRTLIKPFIDKINKSAIQRSVTVHSRFYKEIQTGIPIQSSKHKALAHGVNA